MFSDFSVFHFLIYAAGIGFAAAIIYTNIQRTALSEFINHLISNGCFDESCAVSLEDTGLSNIQKSVVKSAIKNQHGFKRIIGSVSSNVSETTDEETFFEKQDYNMYYISADNVEEIKKKYTFKTMPARLVVLFVAALATIVIITSFFVSWLIDTVSTPKIEENKEEVQEETTIPQDEVIEEDPTEDLVIENEDEAEGPRIPV